MSLFFVVQVWGEVCHLSQSSKTLVFTGFLSRCMQYALKNHCVPALSQCGLTKPNKQLHISMHTDRIS